MRHASAVLYGGECLIFTGEAGSGKSTRVARLILAGGMLVADDVVLEDASKIHAPANIAGVLALRGFGLLRLPYTRSHAPRREISCHAGATLPLTQAEWCALSKLGAHLPEDWMPENKSGTQ